MRITLGSRHRLVLDPFTNVGNLSSYCGRVVGEANVGHDVLNYAASSAIGTGELEDKEAESRRRWRCRRVEHGRTNGCRGCERADLGRAGWRRQAVGVTGLERGRFFLQHGG